MPIREFLPKQGVFEPEAIKAMSDALELACKELNRGNVHDRETVATRIIELASRGMLDPVALSDRVVAEVKVMRRLV